MKKECYKVTRSTQVSQVYLANDGSEIEEKDSVRDLGIIISNDATFSKHVTMIAKKSRMKCAWILRVFQTRDKELMMTLWKSLVRSILEYGCQLWNPTAIGEIREIEQVQRNFTKRIPEIKDESYISRLKSLKLYSLERRR